MGHLVNEHTFAVVDQLEKIAKAHDTTVARVALGWVQAQPGVTSTIIGARRLAQLEDNLKALEVKLTTEELAHLDEKTKPTLGFPASMQAWFPALHNGGTTVNRVYAEPSPFILQRGEKPY
jgi:diketogulonate reductase-like aldo/keto reductase